MKLNGIMNHTKTKKKKKRRDASWVLYMGTYPPRECGIATFTKDLARAVEKLHDPAIKSKILAMNDGGVNIYNYPERVIFEVNDEDIQEHIDAAKRINEKESIKLVSIQHEFGIFGGKHGSYIIPFLEILNKPVITTLHTVLPNPGPKRKRIMQLLAEKSSCLIVMTHLAVKILRTDYGLNEADIIVIPHGAPYAPLSFDNTKEKGELGLKNNIVLSSFGMLNSGKGYEYVIDALPELIKKFPTLIYLIIGETHPIVRKKEGERYRNFLEKKIKKLGLKDHVKFYNKYLKLNEIIKYLGATDIYISSSLNPDQITSGTLAYALGCGKAVISTPFLHAKEAVTPKRGILLSGFKDSKLFSKAILKILTNPKLKKEMEHNAYAYSRPMIWPNVALSYLTVFEKYTEVSNGYAAKEIPFVLPKIKLNHLATLTDDFGVIQFAVNVKPHIISGYSLDDVARALVVCCARYNKTRSKTTLRLILTYLSFIRYVQQEESGKFYNFVNSKKRVNYRHWSEDPHGRAMLALGYTVSSKILPKDILNEAKELFLCGLAPAEKIRSPRAAAFALIGLYFYNRTEQAESSENIPKIRKLADHLVSLYNDHKTPDWRWFEGFFTYSNSKMPESLFYTYLATKDEKYLSVAEDSLNFLISLTFENGMFAPIGQKGWYFKNGKRAYFDQQPVDTATMVQTLALAYYVTRKKRYKELAITAFQWFLGKNHLNQMIYDEATGGCHDGIGKLSVNINEGAESTISYLLSRISLGYFDKKHVK